MFSATNFQQIKTRLLLLIAGIAALGLISRSGLQLGWQAPGVAKLTTSPQIAQKTISIKCDWDLKINELAEYIQKNETAMRLIQEECLWAGGDYLDVTGDGQPEVVLKAVGAGCASCHASRVYVIQREQIIFEQFGDDQEFRKTNRVVGFEIKEPLRKADEAYCCPSEGIVTVYKYFLSDSMFYQHSQYVEPYTSSITGGFERKPAQKKQPTPASKPTSTPQPTPTSNPTKEQALKTIDERINKINQELVGLQRLIDNLLRQEQQDTCNTDRYSNPESEMYIADPYAREMFCARRSQQILAPISQIQARMYALAQERNELERQKIAVMNQP